MNMYWKIRKKILKKNFTDKNQIYKLFHIYVYFYYIIIKIYHIRYNAGIPINNDINPFKAPHGLSGIYISKQAKIGNECIIYQQVTIGLNDDINSPKYGAPKIGNNVYIGAGAKLIGNIKIGDNVKIGANCVCTTDIPENTTVVLQKPRIIYKTSSRDKLE